MNYVLLSIGLVMIFCGIIATYVLMKAVLSVTQSFEKLQSQLISETAKKNQIVISSLPGLLLAVIGAFLINRARE